MLSPVERIVTRLRDLVPPPLIVDWPHHVVGDLTVRRHPDVIVFSLRLRIAARMRGDYGGRIAGPFAGHDWPERLAEEAARAAGWTSTGEAPGTTPGREAG